MKQVRDEAELVEARAVLLEMEKDPRFVTESAYRANTVLWPNNRISFVDAHLSYLKDYPQISMKDYISNLRLQITKRS